MSTLAGVTDQDTVGIYLQSRGNFGTKVRQQQWTTMAAEIRSWKDEAFSDSLVLDSISNQKWRVW